MAAGVRLVLAGDHHDPAAVAADGGDRLDRAVERRDGVDGVVDVQLAEPVDRPPIASAGRCPSSRTSSGGPRRAAELLDRQVDAELAAEGGQRAGEPGAGVDEGHVEVEGDDQGHAADRRDARRQSEPLPRWGPVGDTGRLTSMPRPRRVPVGTLCACALRDDDGVLAGVGLAGAVAAEPDTEPTTDTATPGRHDLYLVTLAGPGSSADRGGRVRPATSARRAVAEQDATLAASVPAPRSTAGRRPQRLRRTAHRGPGPRGRGRPRRRPGRARRGPPAGGRPRRPVRPAPPGPRHVRGGAGTVIGFVDSGIWPDSPLFADVRGLGRSARDFRGACATGAGWPATRATASSSAPSGSSTGFGADRVRAYACLSAARRRRPRHPDGLDRGRQRRGQRAGHEPARRQLRGRRPAGPARGLQGLLDRARPAPTTAARPPTSSPPIDRAVPTGSTCSTSPSTAPDTGIDTVERALLGAAEADIVVVGRRRQPRPPLVRRAPLALGHVRSAARPASPDAARVVAPGAPADRRHGRPRRRPPARLVLGARVAAAGATAPSRGSACPAASTPRASPGASSCASAAGIGRVDKSRGGRAGRRRRHGAGQHHAAARLTADFHSVPTVHLTKDDGRTLRAWMRAHPGRPGHAAPRRRPAHPRAARRLDQLAATRRARSSSPTWSRTAVGVLGATPPVAPRPPLGPRLRHVGRRGPHQRHRRGAAQPPRLVGRRGALRAGHDRRRRRRRPVPAAPGRRAHPGAAPPTARVWCSARCRATTAPGSTATSTRRRSTPRRCCSRAPAP